MRVWLHKTESELVVVQEFFEPSCDSVKLEIKKFPDGYERAVFYGTIFQAGWVITNPHGVDAVFHLGTKQFFEDLGDL